MDDDEKRLFEAVRANPSDDAARQVYADWLLQRGDRRGRLLQLEVWQRQVQAELTTLRRDLPQAWQQLLRPGSSTPPWSSFDFTLTLASAWIPRAPRLDLVGRVHGFDMGDAVKADVERGMRSVFDGEQAYHLPLSHADVVKFFDQLARFDGLLDGTVELEGVFDTSDVVHVVTLQGARNGKPFRASVQFLCSGFVGRSANSLAELAQTVFADTPVDTHSFQVAYRPQSCA